MNLMYTYTYSIEDHYQLDMADLPIPLTPYLRRLSAICWGAIPKEATVAVAPPVLPEDLPSDTKRGAETIPLMVFLDEI